MRTEEIMAKLQAKYAAEKEYLQAVREVLESIEDVYNQHPEFEDARIIERLVEPDRILTFRVTWVDDNGEIQTNTGYRVQFNNAIGPYKGGLRFHPSVNPSILKSTILSDYPGFEEKQIGFKRFSDVMKALEKQGLLVIEMDEQHTMLLKIC